MEGLHFLFAEPFQSNYHESQTNQGMIATLPHGGVSYHDLTKGEQSDLLMDYYTL